MPVLLEFSTNGRGLIDITRKIRECTAAHAYKDGIIHLFLQHTSASLLIQENADPDVLTDLTAHFCRLAPEGGEYVHSAEGPDDMPAHIKTALTQTSLTVPVQSGELMLGDWQAIYLFEHRTAPHWRRVLASFIQSN